MRTNPERALLSAGRNCWRIEDAHRVALLGSAPAYFDALRQALMAARRTVRIVGFHLDPELPLPVAAGREATEAERAFPEPLADLLVALQRRRRGLRSFALGWDAAMLHDPKAEWPEAQRAAWKRDRRLQFCLDGAHPSGAVQQHKLVVVDDALAFVGGIDLSVDRFRTQVTEPAEEPQKEPRKDPRKDPRKNPQARSAATPALQWQAMLDGPAAAALATLAADRWQAAVRRAPRAVRPDVAVPWPDAVVADFTSLRVAVVRTRAAHGAERAVTEVRQLLIDALAAAQQRVVITTPLATAVDLVHALEAPLQAATGPEVLLLTAPEVEGWLDPVAALARRAALLARLQALDRHGRLRVISPKGQVLSTVVVIDDRLLVTGPAALTNRALALDSECCIAIEAHPSMADDPAATSAAIVGWRDRLLAAHLGIDVDTVEDALRAGGSLVALADRCAADTTASTTTSAPSVRNGPQAPPDPTPEQPIAADRFAAALQSGAAAASSSRAQIVAVVVLVVAMLSLTAAWRWTPLSEMVDVQMLAAQARKVADSPLAPLWVLLAFMVGSVVAMPVTLLIVATSLVFSPVWAFAYALTGALAASALNFAIGRAVGGGFVSRIGGQRWSRLNRRLADSGVLAVFTLRILPLAPFVVINLAAGASHVRLRDFMLGSLLGMAPGVLTITVFSDLVARLLRDPSPTAVAGLAAGATLLVAAGWALRRWTQRRQADPASPNA